MRKSRKRASRKRASRRRSRRVSRKKTLKYSAGGGLSSTLYLEDGSVYVGGLKNGVKHGQGTMTWPNGDKYVGEWKNNKFNGYGTFTQHPNSAAALVRSWDNEWKYVGEWKNNKFNGHGTMYWGDGRKYIGEWKNGQRNGKGTMTWDVIPACPRNGTVSGLRVVPENVAYIGEWYYAPGSSLGLRKDGILISDSPNGRRMWRRQRRGGPPSDCIKWPLEELTHILPTTGMKTENIKYILDVISEADARLHSQTDTKSRSTQFPYEWFKSSSRSLPSAQLPRMTLEDFKRVHRKIWEKERVAPGVALIDFPDDIKDSRERERQWQNLYMEQTIDPDHWTWLARSARWGV